MAFANPAPTDLIRETEAVAIAAGHLVDHTSKDYSRIRRRLRAAARRGKITRFTEPRAKARYSRAEVEANREQLGQRPMTQRQHHRVLRDEMEVAGLVDTKTAADLVGVSQSTATGWAQRGLYGATKVHGQWWLERVQLPSAPRPYGPPAWVRCHRCGDLHSRAAWEVRNAQQTGQNLYCGTCWPEVGDEVTAENLQKGRRRFHPGGGEAPANRSAAQQARWTAAGDEQRAAKRAELASGHAALMKSPKRRSEQVAKLVQARHGRDLTAEEQQRVETSARRRMQLDTGRSKTAREEERQMLELWPTGMKYPEIAKTIGTSVSNAERMRRTLELPERPRGRPLRK